MDFVGAQHVASMVIRISMIASKIGLTRIIHILLYQMRETEIHLLV